MNFYCLKSALYIQIENAAKVDIFLNEGQFCIFSQILYLRYLRYRPNSFFYRSL